MKYKVIFLMLFLVIGCSPVRQAYFGDRPNEGKKKSKSSNKTENSSQSVDNEQLETEGDYSEEVEVKRKSSRRRVDSGVDIIEIPEEEFEIDDELMDYGDMRFSDTTFIDLGSAMPNSFDESILSKLDMKESYENALELFDMEKYDEAERKFRYVVETTLPKEIECQESMFHIAECKIGKMNYKSALDELIVLEALEVDDIIREKILVRIGQIHCVRNNVNEAEIYFKKLREFNPESIYLNVADCKKL